MCFCTLRIRRMAVTSIVAVLFTISWLARQQDHDLTIKTWLIMDGNHGKPWFDHGQPWTLNGTKPTMVNHGQTDCEKEEGQPWLVMVNHG